MVVVLWKKWKWMCFACSETLNLKCGGSLGNTEVNKRFIDASPSSWVWSPPGLWFLRLGPPLWAYWSGCSSACETSPLWRCSCHRWSHRRESSLRCAEEVRVITGIIQITSLIFLCVWDEGSHLIFSSKVPRRKTDSPWIHSFILT